MIPYLHFLMPETDQQIGLPIHPYSEAANRLIKFPFKPVVRPWGAGMIRIFNENNAEIREYYLTGATDDDKQIGLVQWPVEFDNC